MKADLQRLWNALSARLALRGSPGTQAHLSETLVPIIDSDIYNVLNLISRASSLNLTGGLGNFVSFATVPAGEYWRVKGMSHGTALASTAVAIQGPEATTVYCQLATTAISGVVFPGIGLRLPPGSKVGASSTGNAGDTAIDFGMMYEVEALPGRGQIP